MMDVFTVAHALLSSGTVVALAWVVALASPALAWLLARILVGAPHRVERGAQVVGRAALVSFGIAALLRVLWRGMGSTNGAPLPWLDGQTGLVWTPMQAAALIGLFHGFAVIVAAVLVARLWRPAADGGPRIPEVGLVRWVLVAFPLVGLVAVQGAWTQQGEPPLLDLAAMLPVVCIALAIWTAGAVPRDTRSPERPTESLAAAAPVADVATHWRRLGAIGLQARPLASLAAREAGGAPRPVDRIWQTTGALGRAPRAVEELGQELGSPGQGWIVGDLPVPTEGMFVSALVSLAARREGLPTLVVCAEPVDLRDRVWASLRAQGAWSRGPLVAGHQELRQAFAAGTLPLVAFLDVADLSREALRSFGGVWREAGPLWCQGVGLVVVVGIDRGTPLVVTHRMFTLRRLGLALRAADARWSVLATGFGGAGGRALVEQAFPSLRIQEVPLGASDAAALRVWRVSEAFRAQPGPAWVRRALEELAKEGRPVSVGDPSGVFDRHAVEVWGGAVHLSREVTLEGIASGAVLGDAWLVAAWRSLPNRAPTPGGRSHEALWELDDNPVIRFLTRDDNIQGLHRAERLPPPRPMIGYANRSLARAHLRAAMHEGRQDVESLSGLFGRDVVEREIEAGFAFKGHAFRLLPQGGVHRRVPLVAPTREERVDPLRATVTDQVVRVVDIHGGSLVEEVDQLVAPTRFYPQRVFAAGARRYRVPLHAYDATRRELRVEQVDPTTVLTRPLLKLEVSRSSPVEAPQAITRDALVYHIASFELTVHEQVAGIWAADGSRITYEPVTATYRSRARAIFFPRPVGDHVLYHLARAFDGVLISHLCALEEDVEVVPAPPGFWPGLPSGLLAIDRHVQGMGAAEAIDRRVIEDVLRWVRAILAGCKCAHGCLECSPRDAFEAGPDKAGVLRLLAGT